MSEKLTRECPACGADIEATEEHDLMWCDTDIPCKCGALLEVESEESWNGSSFWLVEMKRFFPQLRPFQFDGDGAISPSDWRSWVEAERLGKQLPEPTARPAMEAALKKARDQASLNMIEFISGK